METVVDERALLRALDRAPEAILVLDTEARLVALNRTAQALFDLRPREVLGRTVHELEALLQRQGRPEGAALEVAVTPLPDAAPGEPATVVTVRQVGDARVSAHSLHDLAKWVVDGERRSWERAWGELSLVLEAMAAHVRHVHTDELPTSVRQHLQQMERMLAHADALLRQAMRLVERSEAPAAPVLNLTAVPVPQVVHESVAMMEGLARERNIRLACRPLPPLMVKGDETRLRQLLLDLLHHALMLQRPGGRIWVEAGLEDQALRVSMWGDEPLLMLPEGESSGQRWDLCREQLAALGGTLGMNVSESEGACFWFMLPLD